MSDKQEDWVDFLALAEFAYNNSIHASTKVSPFFANYGFHPRFNISIPANSVNPSAETRARTLHDVHHDISLELCIVGDQYKDQANRHRLAAPTFAVGDMVWLLRRHIATTRPCAKLDYKNLGPYHRENQRSFFPISTAPDIQDSQCFSRFPPRKIPSFSNSGTSTSSTATCGIVDRGRI